MNIAVIGTDEIGLSTAILLAYMNHFVIIVDDNQTKIELLRNNSLHFYEPYLNDSIKIVNSSLYYTTNVTSAIEQSDVVFFTSDAGYNLMEVALVFSETIKSKFRILVNKSPTQLGLTVQAGKVIREKSDNFAVAYEMPGITTGSIIIDTFYPEKIVVGVNNLRAASILDELYRPIIEKSIILPDYLPQPHRQDGQLIITDIGSAELAYHAEKIFKGVKSSFLNEINNLANQNGAKTDEVIRVLKATGINSLNIKYGLGWSRKEYGESFEMLNDIAISSNIEVPIIDSALRSNYNQRDILIHKIANELGGLNGKTIGIMGLTYKPFTDDLTDSPSVDIIRVLLEHGTIIKAHDPVASFKMPMKFPDFAVEYCESVYDLFKDTDIIIFCTEWPEYFDIDWFQLGQTMHQQMIFDARNCLSVKDFTSMGFKVLSFN